MKSSRDGHIHSHYCPHGTKDEFEKYIENALKRGLKEISFTEHLPLPHGCMKQEEIDISAPSEEVMLDYFNEINLYKEKYKGKIKINAGVEVDYLEGLEDKTKEMLDKYGEYIEDSILSVHFFNIDDKYYCMDASKSGFGLLIDMLGDIDKVYDKFYETLLKSINSDLGKYKPKRIGHPTLIRIFNLEYPHEYKNTELMETVVKAIKEKDYEIDYNSSGLRKPYCKEKYPSGKFMELVKKYNIRMVNGSDSHAAEDVGKGF